MIALMECRSIFLEQAVEGLRRSGVPLVAWTDAGYAPAGITDDLGIYLFVPLLASILGIEARPAADVFLVGITVLGLISGMLGSIKLCSGWLSRAITCGALAAMSYLMLRAGDVYLIPAALMVGATPWLLWSVRRRDHRTLMAVAPICGALIVLANFSRSQAGTGLLLFLILLILTAPGFVRRARLNILLLVAVGVLLTSLVLSRTVEASERFLAVEGVSSVEHVVGHPLWHTVYIGLGYLPNKHGIEYSDTIAAERVEALNPGTPYVSEEYERTLRNDVLRLAREDPLFVARVMLAKMAKIARRLLVYANIGLIAALVRPKARYEDAAFALALMFFAVPGLAAIPAASYLLGFAATATLFGVVSIDWAIRTWRPTEAPMRPAHG